MKLIDELKQIDDAEFCVDCGHAFIDHSIELGCVNCECKTNHNKAMRRALSNAIERITQLEADLEERTKQFHLAEVKVMSREAIIEQLSDSELAKDVTRLEGENEAMFRLLAYAGGILGHGTPGDAWMDWSMRVQGLLGLKFWNARWKDGKAIPFDELKERVSDIPRKTTREIRADALLTKDD